MTDRSRKFFIFFAAIVLAGLIVVGLLLWFTDSLPFFADEEQPENSAETIVIDEPTPQPTSVARITPEAASTDRVPASSSPIAGTTTTAATGPAEFALTLATAISLLGLSGSLWLFKLA
ncbi:MAG: hypothetical protein HYR90_01295 [Candidatus Andersenbacteria bacterium]|nr:hypothetical protein [Candidatus Andersenbacteria bacterium]MBI3250501.1 hypothetical protein [Candidatus Andersenbacteria bacterium]